MQTLRDPRWRPTHPGEILREDVLPALKMTQTELARLLDVSRLSISELVNEKRALTPEMAVRLGILFKISPEPWLRMQHALDLWEVRQKPAAKRKVKPLPRKRRVDLLAA